MEVGQIRRIIEMQRDAAELALSAIDGLMLHSEKQAEEIKKLTNNQKEGNKNATNNSRED